MEKRTEKETRKRQDKRRHESAIFFQDRGTDLISEASAAKSRSNRWEASAKLLAILEKFNPDRVAKQ